MFENLQTYYKGKKVFVTGHTGFKGSWLIAWLHMLGADIMGYALKPDNNFDLYNEIDGDSICQSIIADIRTTESVRDAILSFQPDFIFHLAAQPLVLLSYEQPVCTFEINAIGTANILDATRQLQKKCAVIVITTDKVYENKEWVYPYRENDRLGGYDPYSASKACAEVIINSFRCSFFHPAAYASHKKCIASARAGNVIGGGDWAKDRIIPDIVRALRNNENVQVRNPQSIRPWQHVLEPIGGYLLLGARMKDDPFLYADAFNFGPKADDNTTVQRLVETALLAWGTGQYENLPLSARPHEAGLLKLDISKAMCLLEWKPKWSSEDAIIRTIKWYKANSLNKGITRDLVIHDINAYNN